MINVNYNNLINEIKSCMDIVAKICINEYSYETKNIWNVYFLFALVIQYNINYICRNNYNNIINYYILNITSPNQEAKHSPGKVTRKYQNVEN